MGLMIPYWGWANASSNITGTPATTEGTLVTGGSANTDGSTVTLLSALGHDCELLEIGSHTSSANAANTSALLDIMIDPAGGTSWATTPLISDLLTGYTGSLTATGPGIVRWFYFPIWIKSGTSIGARVRSATASGAQRVLCN